MNQATIEAFNKFYESTAQLCSSIADEFVDMIKMIADKLDEVVEIIEEINSQEEADSKRIQFIESYKKPVKDYLVVFEILKIPIKNQV